MVVAQVTRESVQQAIASGITAQQVSLLGEGVGGKKGCTWVVGSGVVTFWKSSMGSVSEGGGELSVCVSGHEKSRLSVWGEVDPPAEKTHVRRSYNSEFVSQHHHFLAARWPNCFSSLSLSFLIWKREIMTVLASRLLIVLTSAISASPIAQLVKNLPTMQETMVRFLGRGNPLEKG